MPISLLSLSEFSKRIKAKHPEYQDIDDDELVSKIVQKYPEYKSQLEIPSKKEPSLASRATRLVAETVGVPADLAEIAVGLARRPDVRKKIAQVVELPARGGRAIGVGAQRLIEGVQPYESALEAEVGAPAKIAPGTLSKAIIRAGEAAKVGYKPEVGERAGAAIGEIVGSAPAFTLATGPLPAINYLGPNISQRTALGMAHGGFGNTALNILNQMAGKGQIEPQEAIEALKVGVALGGGLEATVGTAGLSLKILQRFRQGYYDEVKVRPRNVTPEILRVDEGAFTQDLAKARQTDLVTAEHLGSDPNVDPKSIIDLKVASGIPESIAQQSVTQAQDTARFISKIGR